MKTHKKYRNKICVKSVKDFFAPLIYHKLNQELNKYVKIFFFDKCTVLSMLCDTC